jgi:hypothetical protein
VEGIDSCRTATGVALPLITATYLVFAAGLLAGFGGIAWIAFAVSGLSIFPALSRRRPERVALVMVFAAAAIIAAASPAPERRSVGASRAAQPTDLLTRTRARAARSIDQTFGEDAPMARALLIADQRQIPTEMRDRYAAAGLVHMLSISGLHVAIIAAAMELLFQVARMSRRVSLFGAFVATGVYVAVIGAPAPALRSAAMLGVTMASRMAQRPT